MSDAPRTIRALGNWPTEKLATVACFCLLAGSMWYHAQRDERTIKHIDSLMERLDAEQAAREAFFGKLTELMQADIDQDERLTVAMEKLVVVAASWEQK